jgi:hypothetical protein
MHINVLASEVINGSVSEEELEKFLKSEKRYIEKSKWYKGERTQTDPGEKYIIEWIGKNAERFRKVWDVCLCKDCIKASECGDCLKIDCDDFLQQ